MRCRNLLQLLFASVIVTSCAANGDNETRTIELAHMKPDQAFMLVEPYVGDARSVRATENPSALTITASTAKLDQIEELLQRYDVASPSVRLHFQVIEADGFTQSDPAIANVEAALRELFRFRGYRLVADALMTGTFAEVSQTVVGPGEMALDIKANISKVTAVEGRKSVELTVYLVADRQVILQSGVTVPDGQTVVLGTARPRPNVGALILVVRPQIQ